MRERDTDFKLSFYYLDSYKNEQKILNYNTREKAKEDNIAQYNTIITNITQREKQRGRGEEGGGRERQNEMREASASGSLFHFKAII